MAKRMRIREWIEQLESDRSLSLAEFYGVLKDAREVIDERLSIARDEGLQLSELPEMDA